MDFGKNEEYEKIHLTDIEKPSYVSKTVTVDARPVLIGQTCFIPHQFFLRCPYADKKVSYCPVQAEAEKNGNPFSCSLHKFTKDHSDQNEAFVYTISKNDSRIIDAYKSKSSDVKGKIYSIFPCKAKDYQLKSQIREPKVLSVREAVFYPSAKIIERGSDDAIIDESGKPFRQQKLFYISDNDKLITADSVLTITGKIIPNPQNQVPTIAVTSSRTSDDDFRNFKLTNEIKGQFKRLSEVGIEGIAKELPSLTKIYGRDLTHLLIMLVYHSVPSFKFEGDSFKGILDALFIGDAGVGKTKILKTLIQKLKLGQFMTGSCSSRTGVSYSVVQIGGIWEVQWGAYPANDMGLLIIDEGQDISNSDWENLSVGRSDQVITVDRVAKGEHPSRTRLIVSANPKYGQQIDSELYPCVHIKQLFTTKDIRRFDFAQFLGTNDVNKDCLLKNENTPLPDWLNSEILKNSVYFAWSRKSEQICFSENVSNALTTYTRLMIDRYGPASDIPLVTSDMRAKILRLSVAHAVACHQTDVLGESVIVTEKNIIAVYDLLNQVYCNSNLALDLYANLMRDESYLTDEEFHKIVKELFPNDLGKVTDDIRLRNVKILMTFCRNPEMTGFELGTEMDWDRKTIGLFLEEFKKFGLITAKRGSGYKTTRKLNNFLKILKQRSGSASIEKSLDAVRSSNTRI